MPDPPSLDVGCGAGLEVDIGTGMSFVVVGSCGTDVDVFDGEVFVSPGVSVQRRERRPFGRAVTSVALRNRAAESEGNFITKKEKETECEGEVSNRRPCWSVPLYPNDSSAHQ